MRVFFTASGVVAGIVLIVAACRGPQLDEHCDATRIEPLLADKTVFDECVRCVEVSCCEKLGACERDDACRAKVKEVHHCVVGLGRHAGFLESTCTSNLVGPAEETYACMRLNCGAACGLPVCKLDPRIAPLPTRRCDDCFGRSCCKELNACANDRACLHVLDCITRECVQHFERQLTSATFPLARALRAAACEDGGEGLADEGGPPQGVDEANCFGRCAARYLAPADDGDAALGPGVAPELLHSACLVAGVFECSAEVECGKHCVLPDGAAIGGDAAARADAAEPRDATDARDAN